MIKKKVPHRFSIEDYDRMIATGILTENDRVELIRGEILEKMPIGDPHIACVNRLTRLLGKLVGDRAILSVQNPIQVGDSEPEPDIALFPPRDDFYAAGKPRPEEILLVIEVADSSLEFDRDVKGPIYAEAGIAEYWIVNVIDARLEVYREPQADGSFGTIKSLTVDDMIEITALPGAILAIAEFLK